MPRISRPWLTSSRAVAIFARIAGLRKVLQSTRVPSSTRCVASASAASTVQPSQIPWAGSSALRVQQVVADPDAVEAVRFRPLRDLADHLVRAGAVGRAIAGGLDHQPDLHGVSSVRVISMTQLAS